MIATTEAPAAPADPLPATGPVWGEIVTWSARSSGLRRREVLDALAACGLDTAVAGEFRLRNAWRRACTKLEQDRVIEELSPDDKGHLRFQFNSRLKGDDTVTYPLEAIFTIDPRIGTVSCDVPELREAGEKLLKDCLEIRTGSDVTGMIQRLFEKNADLFPIRDQGGCYFVPAEHSAFVDRVADFVHALKGTIKRFPIPKGSAHGDAAVCDSVSEGLAARVAEHKEAVAAWDAETRQGTIDRAVNRVRVTREKVVAYAEYLGDEKQRLLRELEAADRELRAKVLELGKTTETAAVVATAAGD